MKTFKIKLTKRDMNSIMNKIGVISNEAEDLKLVKKIAQVMKANKTREIGLLAREERFLKLMKSTDAYSEYRVNMQEDLVRRLKKESEEN